MKNTFLFIVALIFIINNAVAQDIKTAAVPASVKSALVQKYPAAGSAKVSWEKEKGNYEANWGGRSGEDMSVQFTPDGTFIEEVKAISPSDLPTGVTAYLKAHYAGVTIREAGIVTDAKGNIRYEAEVKGKDMVFEKDGTPIR